MLINVWLGVLWVEEVVRLEGVVPPLTLPRPCPGSQLAPWWSRDLHHWPARPGALSVEP